MPAAEMQWHEYTPFGLLAAIFFGLVCIYKLYGLYNFETEQLLKILEGQAVTFVLLTLVLVDLSLMGLNQLKIFPEGGCDVCQEGDAKCHGDDGKFKYGVMGSDSELEIPENSDTCFALEVYSNVMTIIYLVELTLKMGCFYRIRTLASFFEEKLCLIDFIVVIVDLLIMTLDAALRNPTLGLTLPDWAGFLTNADALKTLKLARVARLARVANAAVAAAHVDVMEACQTGNLGMLNRALVLGQSIHCKTYFGETPLHVVASQGHTALARRLLEQPSMNEKAVQARDESGRTPLFLAAFFSRREIVQLLLLKVKDMDGSLAVAPWKGGHIGMTPEVVLRRRGLFDIIEDIRAKREAIRKVQEAEEAKRRAEEERLQEIADRNRERIENKLRVRLAKMAAGEKEQMNRGFQRWCAFVDSVKYGKYDELASADLDQMTKREIIKHLQARGQSIDNLGRLGHFPLKQMLQKSLWEEAERRGLHTNNQLTNQMTLKTFGRALESEEDPEKKAAMMKELKERKRAARDERKAEAAARRATNMQRYSTKMTAAPGGRKSMHQRKLEALREKHKTLRALSMAAEGEHESESEEDDVSTEHDGHLEIQNISDDELGLGAGAESNLEESANDGGTKAPRTAPPRPGMSKMLSVRSAKQFDELGLSNLKSSNSKRGMALGTAEEAKEGSGKEKSVGDHQREEVTGSADGGVGDEDETTGRRPLRSMRMLGSWRGSKKSEIHPAAEGAKLEGPDGTSNGDENV